jgi:hypothetical protein
MATTGDPWPFGIRCFKVDEVMLGRGEALRRAIEGDDTWMIFGVRMVNPDRHARIRAKHFTFAAELWDCEALDPSRRPFDVDGIFDWQNAMMDHDRAHGYFEAARNSAWGVS